MRYMHQFQSYIPVNTLILQQLLAHSNVTSLFRVLFSFDTHLMCAKSIVTASVEMMMTVNYFKMYNSTTFEFQ